MSTPATTPDTNKDRSSGQRMLVILFGATLMVSAGLLFWLQPMIAKLVLPKVGGTPAVWNTAMLFFQTALLVGYAYAHILSRRFSLSKQMVVHLALLGLCILWLPIGLGEGAPQAGDDSGFGPSFWILGQLAVGIGVPFVVIAGSAPILQSWFARSLHKDAANPYFLYAASNVGSLGALFAFPLLIEPTLDLGNQQRAWSLVFGLLVVLTAISARTVRRALAPAPERNANETPTPPPTLTTRFMWLALVAASTSLMLGVTTHLTTDVAAVPLLWVLPLGLYLLTFILVFARKQMVSEDHAAHLMLAVVIIFGLQQGLFRDVHWMVWALILMAVFAFTALACHSELARLKPASDHLTSFYLWIATGGMLGGAFNALAAPVLFNDVIEFHMMLAVSIVLVLAARNRAAGKSARAYLSLAGLCIAAPVVASQFNLLETGDVLVRERNFYGVLSVRENTEQNARLLGYGTTVHGVQDIDPSNPLIPLSYYHLGSPAADLMRTLGARPSSGDKPGKVGAIGLGVGAIACYAVGGRDLVFFEINPGVTRLATNTMYFRYLNECSTPYTVIHGDGRLKLAEHTDGAFDMLFVDAFTSDSIPVHLLTLEAVQLYFKKLAPGGMVAIHISNKHLDLAPVVAAIARDLGLTGLDREVAADKNPRRKLFYPRSRYVVLARQQKDLVGLKALPGWKPLPSAKDRRAWTDSYSNIIGAFSVFW